MPRTRKTVEERRQQKSEYSRKARVQASAETKKNHGWTAGSRQNAKQGMGKKRQKLNLRAKQKRAALSVQQNL